MRSKLDLRIAHKVLITLISTKISQKRTDLLGMLDIFTVRTFKINKT